MENSAYLLRSTRFERAAKRGVKSALLTAKKKTVALLAKGTHLAIAAEAPSAEQIQKYGAPPPIYSREINYWLWEVAVDLLKNRPELGCLYIHTTDVKHHRTFGGTGYVWLRSPKDEEAAVKILKGLAGVEAVLARDEAARKFHLMPERIGELVVLGDRETVFGETEPDVEVEQVPPTFRTHGSLHEAVVPLVIFNASGTLPSPDSIRVNFDLTRTLYRD
jgi:hypothetical protein